MSGSIEAFLLQNLRPSCPCETMFVPYTFGLLVVHGILQLPSIEEELSITDVHVVCNVIV